MGKGWLFRKTKNDHEAGSFRAGKKKKPRVSRYVPVEFVHQLFDENRPAPWRDVSLPGGWYLNSRRVPVPPVPCEGRECRDEIRRRFILPPDLRDDLAFALNSYNWVTFGTWEFHPRRQAGYLGDVGYFNRERGVGLDNEDEEEGDDNAEDHEDAPFDNGGAPAPPAVDPELQPVELTEEEALELAITQSELDELGQWHGLATQLRNSSLAQGRPVTPTLMLSLFLQAQHTKYKV